MLTQARSHPLMLFQHQRWSSHGKKKKKKGERKTNMWLLLQAVGHTSRIHPLLCLEHKMVSHGTLWEQYMLDTKRFLTLMLPHRLRTFYMRIVGFVWLGPEKKECISNSPCIYVKKISCLQNSQSSAVVNHCVCFFIQNKNKWIIIGIWTYDKLYEKNK